MRIDTKDFEKFRRIVLAESKKADREEILVVAKDDKFNRRALDYGRFDVLIGVESFGENWRRDKLRNLDSGFNHVMANIAKRKGIAIGVDLEGLQKLGKKEKGVRLSRIRRNIGFCRKSGAQILLFGCKDKNEGMGFMLSLGASSKQAKDSIDF